MRKELIQKIAVAFELCGGVVLSDPAKAAVVADLEQYTEKQVSDALDRCRRECKRLTPQDIIERIDDGRPGPQEAWSMLPKGEEGSIVWTDEMAEAYGAIREMGDQVAKRMSFIETYTAAVTRARAQHLPVNWSPSLGTDPNGRDRALIEAVEKGRLRGERVLSLMARPEEMPPRLFPESHRPKALPVNTAPIPGRQKHTKALDAPMSVSAILEEAGFKFPADEPTEIKQPKVG